MTSPAVNYLLGPQAARLRVYISAVFVAVAVVVFVASPGLWVTGLWLALVVAWGGVTVSAYRRARSRPAASISAPKAGALAEDARSSRRHAVEFGLPVDPWSQLEAFWSVAGDIPIVVEPIAALTATEPDPFMDEFRSAMCTPLGTPLKVNEALSPDSPVSFAAGLANRLLAEFDEVDPLSARAETLRENLREWDAEFARRYGETRDAAWVDAGITIHNRLAADLETRRRHDEPFDLDAFVERTRRKYGPPERRTHQDRLAIEAEVDAYAAHVVERREAQRRQRDADEVRIVNGAGETLAVHPSVERWESLTHQVRNVEQVRCTWRLQGTAEDDHAIRALRASGVKVTLINEYPMSKTRPNVAELEGAQSAINQAHATYVQGLRERTAAGKVTG